MSKKELIKFGNLILGQDCNLNGQKFEFIIICFMYLFFLCHFCANLTHKIIKLQLQHLICNLQILFFALAEQQSSMNTFSSASPNIVKMTQVIFEWRVWRGNSEEWGQTMKIIPSTQLQQTILRSCQKPLID